MNCTQFAERRDERIDGDLPPDVALAWDAHFAACERCRAAEEAAREDESLLRSAVDAFPVRAGFVAGVRAAVRPRHTRGRVLIAGGAMLAVAAAILITVLARPDPFVVDRSEGDLFRLPADGDRWESVGTGTKLETGDLLLTPTVDDGYDAGRAWLLADGRRVTLDAGSLVLVGAERVRLLRGRARVEASGETIELQTPYGSVRAESADFVVEIDYDHEPVLLVDDIRADGWAPALATRLVASIGRSASGRTGPPAGGAEVAVSEGAVVWRALGGEGALGRGETLRLSDTGAVGAAAADDDAWARADFRTAGSRPLRGASDPVAKAIDALGRGDAAARVEAAAQLGGFGVTGDALRALRARIEVEEDPSVRRAVLRALARLDRAAARDAAERSFTDGSVDVRCDAVRLWLRVDGDPAALERFVDDEDAVAACALEVLIEASERESVAVFLTSPNPTLVRRAREALDD